MILIGSKPFASVLYFLCQKTQTKIGHKKVFPSDKSPFLKEKNRNSSIVHSLTLREKN